MSLRNILTALLTLSAIGLIQSAYAIAADEVIDPSGSQIVEPSEESSAAMQGLFSGESASSGALITIIGYAVILGAVGVVVWYLFKSGFMRKSFAKGEGKLKVSETRMLGNRQFISVVEYGSQKILIGVGPGKIDYLTTLQNSNGDFPELEVSESPQLQGGQS